MTAPQISQSAVKKLVDLTPGLLTNFKLFIPPSLARELKAIDHRTVRTTLNLQVQTLDFL